MALILAGVPRPLLDTTLRSKRPASRGAGGTPPAASYAVADGRVLPRDPGVRRAARGRRMAVPRDRARAAFREALLPRDRVAHDPDGVVPGQEDPAVVGVRRLPRRCGDQLGRPRARR